MKKTFKTFFALALGLSLTLAGCSDDENGLQDDLTGNYSVNVGVGIMEGLEIPTTLTVTKQGDGFKVAATVTLPAIPGAPVELPSGNINISLLLSSLKEVSYSEGGRTAKGYLYKIASQPITVGNLGSFDFVGAGGLSESESSTEEYDGMIATFTQGSQSGKGIAFGIVTMLEGDIPLYIYVESQDMPDAE